MRQKENIKELADQYNNYIYPKPTQNLQNEWIKNNRFQICDPNYCWHRLWPEKPYSDAKMNILIAGCGSDQAAILAKCNPNHNFVGIDLSEKSLDHQKKLIKENQIKNLELQSGDFRKIKFNFQFDYIISSGVIHHLEDPSSGLEYFDKNLKEKGVLYLMVYGDKKSFATNQINNFFNKLELKQNKDSINFVKNTISKLNKHHPARIFCEGEIKEDLNHDSGIVDFFLHKNENFYSIKNLIKLLSKNNLIIKNFANGKLKPLTKFFADAPENIKKKINMLSVEDKLELSQILNWNDRKIDIICCKSNNKKDSLIYNNINILKIYTFQYHGIEYKINNQNLDIFDPINNNTFSFKFLNKKINWKEILNGQNTVFSIMKNFNDSEKKNFLDKINFMIDNSILDISFHPIASYKKYYSNKTN